MQLDIDPASVTVLGRVARCLLSDSIEIDSQIGVSNLDLSIHFRRAGQTKTMSGTSSQLF
jgi:hypothetical protein